MLSRLKNWLKGKSSTSESNSAGQLKGTGRHVVAGQPIKTSAPKRTYPRNSDTAAAAGRGEDHGANKNKVVRNQYIRESTGTHETLKILDSSLPDPDDEANIDPYNTGGFDRSKNWANRSQK
jgi:hypothetical protein